MVGGVGVGVDCFQSVGVRRVELEEKGEELLESSHGMSEVCQGKTGERK